METRLSGLGIPRSAYATIITGPVRLSSDAMARVPARIGMTESLTDDLAEFEGGLRIGRSGSGSCTLGFNAYWGESAALVTASHCNGPTDSDSIWTDNPQDWFQASTSTGTQIASDEYDPVGWSCAGQHTCRYSDAALQFYSTSGYTMASIARTVERVTGSGSLVIDGTTPHIEITGWQMYSVWGQTIDKIGRNTGWTYGHVSATCVMGYPSNTSKKLLCLDQSEDLETGSGDSGAPIFHFSSGSGTATLVGIHRGRNGGGAIYSPILNIWMDYPGLSDGTTRDVTSFYTYLNGPSQIPYYQTCVWYAEAAGGLPPYSFVWSGVISGGGSYVYGGDLNGTLYLDVYSWDDHQQSSTPVGTSEEGSC